MSRVNNIMTEYNKKKYYEKKFKLEKFKKQFCDNCKNKHTNLCEIRYDINNQLSCIYYKNDD